MCQHPNKSYFRTHNDNKIVGDIFMKKLLDIFFVRATELIYPWVPVELQMGSIDLL